MFPRLGEFLSRYWFAVLMMWAAAFGALRLLAPPFNDVARGGEFVFLPDEMNSRQAEMLFSRAFPDRKTTSNIVIVVDRNDGPTLTDEDLTFVTDKLTPALEKIRDQFNGTFDQKTDSKPATFETKLMTDIHNFSDHGIGRLLMSQDQKATLVTVELSLDFQDTRNWQPVRDIENTVQDLAAAKETPKGLEISVTGSSVLGRDLTQAESDSAKKTGPLTVGMVIVLLVVIYRAPLLALVPLLTLFLAVDSALNLMVLLGSAGYVPLFKGLKEYTTVISYGPGVDYCLFLISRYKENLKASLSPKESLSAAMGQVGPAILASAATVICGIGMLTFAQFGKFHDAGIGISIALIVTLVAVLTLTPSMLFMVGHWAFWPMTGIRGDQAGKREDAAVQSNFFQPMWDYMGRVIEQHPLRTLLVTVAAMVPLMGLGLYYYGNVSYGLLESLPKSAKSARGARELERHFPAGITGPIQVILQNDKIDFADDEGTNLVQGLVDGLMKDRKQLEIADIRSVADPLGTAPTPKEGLSDESFVSRTVERKETHKRGIEHYVSSAPNLSGHVTELEFIPTTNPFAMESILLLDRLMAVIPNHLPADQRANTKILVLGPTASVRDVNLISHSDQWRIYLLVVSCVLVILIVLLRAITISIYLILTVLMSYVATLGMTWLLFYSLDPHGFIGLDWTVPLFLFVVLIAVGEDYNILLVTRVHEEQKRLGAKKGIVEALSRTGGIITSCGFIMAGTFASLCPNALVRMQQLGFALAFGVLLDTFVIRPILVPSFLMLLNDDRYGNLGRYLK